MSGTDESGQVLSNVEKTQCAIVLLHSLPCARHAVLEQLCDVFHEAVQKYVVELERQALSGKFYFYYCKIIIVIFFSMIQTYTTFPLFCKAIIVLHSAVSLFCFLYLYAICEH